MKFWEAIKDLEEGKVVFRKNFNHFIYNIKEMARYLNDLESVDEVLSNLNAEWALCIPEKKRHECLSPLGNLICFEHADGRLILDAFCGSEEEVKCCPFCGWSKD